MLGKIIGDIFNDALDLLHADLYFLISVLGYICTTSTNKMSSSNSKIEQCDVIVSGTYYLIAVVSYKLSGTA